MGTSEPPNNQSDQAARDAQWVREVYRPHDPQLTVRAVFAGMFVGAIMSLSNVYVVLKTGWSLGVTLTSCVIAFAVFELLHAMRLVKRPLGILENNAVGSVASAAGFIGSLPGFGVIGPWLYAWGGPVGLLRHHRTCVPNEGNGTLARVESATDKSALIG